MLNKLYTRCWQGKPETGLIEHARRGFWTLGIETASYEGDAGLKLIKDLGPDVGVSGFISDIQLALKMLGLPIPANVDYPNELQDLLGREIKTSTLGEVRQSTSPIFVKPQEHKCFTGFVWDGSERARRNVITQPDEVPVYTSEIINFVSEYRSFILENKVLDVRRYKGDWSVAPNKEVVLSAVNRMVKPPAAYCLDWGIDDKGRTLLVEMNEGFAFGHYGLDEVYYARMLSARWEEFFK